MWNLKFTTPEPIMSTTILKADWGVLPQDVVDQILELLDKYNREFHINRIIRIDQIQRWAITPGVALEQSAPLWVRTMRNAPPVSYTKYISRGALNHYDCLLTTLRLVKQALIKRKIISGDSNIKPSKLKYKYCKQIQEKNMGQWG